MSAEPVNGWDSRALVVSESTFGVPVDPAANQELELISCSMGPSEVGITRPKKDRNSGRGMQNAFVEGRVQAIPFMLETSVKTRAAANTISKEWAIYKAAGILGADFGSNWGWSTLADPVTAGYWASLGIYRALGGGVACYEAEQLRGGVIKSLNWSGGDKECILKASGVGIGKYHQGYLTSVTLANGSVATMTITAEESYRLSPGYYQIEAEIIHLDSVVAGATSCAITRGQLSTSGAAHTAKACYPYFPAVSYTGNPISEASTSGTLDGVALRILSWSIDYTTGIDLLPGETGSAYIQGFKVLRNDCKATFKSVMHREEASWLGKARARKNMALSLVQGTGTGGGITFSLPNCEINPIVVPDTPGDTVIVDVTCKGKDSSGNDMFSFSQT